MTRVEARIEAVEPEQRAYRQPGGDQQHQAERDLGGDQRATGPGAAHAGDAAAGLVQHVAYVQAAGEQGGHKAEDQAGGNRDAQHNGEHARVQLDGVPELVLGRAQLLQPVEREAADADTHDATGERHQHALHQQLAHDGGARCAERHPRGDLAGARAGSRQQKPGDVYAANQQHHEDGGPGEQQFGAGVHGVAGAQRDNAFLKVLRLAGESGVGNQRPAERAQLLARLRPAYAGFETGDDAVIAAAPFTVSAGAQGCPDIHRGIVAEPRRHDAHHGVLVAAQADSAAQRPRVAVQGALPELVTQYGDGRTVGNVFFALELAAGLRRDAQHPEIAGRDAVLLDVLGSIAGGKVGATGLGVGGDVQTGDVVAHGLEERAGLGGFDVVSTAAPVSGDHQS